MKAGYRSYSGVCAQRGKTIHRGVDHTSLIKCDEQMVRVGRCMCGLLVFLQSKNNHPIIRPHAEDDYRGADHE